MKQVVVLCCPDQDIIFDRLNVNPSHYFYTSGDFSMDIFRDAFNNGVSVIQRSPDRKVFGLHPSSGKVLVPIDICLLTLGSDTPDYTLPLQSINADVLSSPLVSLIGKVQFVDTPNSAIDVNPIVTLDSTSSSISTIDSVNINTIAAGDSVYIKIDSSTTVSGKILQSMTGATSGQQLLESQIFPMDFGLRIQAIRVSFSIALGSDLQGSPIFKTSNNKVLGMLVGSGQDVLAFHF